MLKIVVLTGKLQGSEVNLFEGQTIGSEDSYDFIVKTPSLSKNHVEVLSDSSGNFILSSPSKTPIFELGGEKVAHVNIMPGLIFSIDEVGFSVQEEDAKVSSTTDSGEFDIKKALDTNARNTKAVFPLKKPIVLDFVRGTLINTSMELHWSPYSIGAKSNLHHFIDENLNLEEDLFSIEKSSQDKEKEALLRPLISNFISINGQLISKPTIVKSGDLIEFSNTALYIKIK